MEFHIKLLCINKKKVFTFKPVFIGYGLKTGQGFYPGPNFFNPYKEILLHLYPSSFKYFIVTGKINSRFLKAFWLS